MKSFFPKQAKELLDERPSDKTQVILLMRDKFTYMWGANDPSIKWSLMGLDRTEQLLKHLSTFDRVTYMSFALYGVSSMLFCIFSKRSDNSYPLFLILLLGYAFVHLLIEVQTRYRFEIMPCMYIFLGYGVYALTHSSPIPHDMIY